MMDEHGTAETTTCDACGAPGAVGLETVEAWGRPDLCPTCLDAERRKFLARLAKQQARCRTCGVPIIWVEGAKTHRPMPVDAAPRGGGNMILYEIMAEGYPILGEVVGRGASGDQLRFMGHFATCPHAAQHRRRS
jgi:hypothetical protein